MLLSTRRINSQSSDHLLRSIRDLREEREAGRIAQADFDRRHRGLKRRAIRALMLHDALLEARKRQLSSPSAALMPETLQQVETLVAQRKEST